MCLLLGNCTVEKNVTNVLQNSFHFNLAGGSKVFWMIVQTEVFYSPPDPPARLCLAQFAHRQREEGLHTA